MRVCCVFLWVWLLLCTSQAHAQTGDGTVQWMVMETPHFYVYYPRGVYRFALRAARLSEEAHSALAPYVGHAPTHRSHVIILNNSDDANGAATSLPRNTMFLFTAPPDARGTLHDSDDWLRGLIYHEYLHILHLDTMSQVYRMVNRVLGKVFAPNLLMPRWWIEGWATYVETAYTGGGRGRSSLFDAYMRAAIFSGKPLRLSQVSHVTATWPRGTAAYLYGSRFLTYVAKKYGKKRLAEIAYAYGASLFPYNMNLVVRDVVKKSYEQLWQEWLGVLRKEYGAIEKRVRKYPLTQVRQLTKGGEWLGVPRYSADGKKLLVFRVNGRTPERIEEIDRATKRTRTLTLTNSFSLFGTDRKGKIAVLSQVEVSRAIYSYYDLYFFSPKTGQLRRWTHRERAKEPDVSPDGTEVAYIKHKAGSSALWIRGISPKHKHHKGLQLYQPKRGVFLSGPRYSPDGKRIVLSVWFPGGARDLMLFDRDTKKLTRLTNDRAQDIEPVFSPSGEEVIYASDLSGTYNLYALRLSDKRVRRLTNELCGAFAPAISPDGKWLAFARFGEDGLDLVEMPFSHKEAPYPMPTHRKKWPKLTYKTPRVIYPVRPYQPAATLLPIAWLPLFSVDVGGQTVGVRFNGSDILGFHSYDVSLSYGIDSQEVAYSLSYRYSQLYPTIAISHGRFARTAFGAAFVNGQERRFSERVTYARLDLEIPLAFWLSSHFFYVRYEMNYLEAIDLTIPLRPEDVPPVFPEMGLLTRLTFGWSYSSARRYGRSISAEQGRRIYLQVSLQHPYLGSIGESWNVLGGWSEFVAMPWLKQHVLAFNVVGTIGRSSFRNRQLFFLGGIPPQDLFQSVLGGGAIGPGYLRGYPPARFSGDASLLLQTEYRLPVLDIERGLGVAPAFIRRLYFVFFGDVGQTFQEPYGWEQFAGVKVGVGMELRLEALIGYYLNINLRFGFAKGLMDGGIDHLYLVLGSSF